MKKRPIPESDSFVHLHLHTEYSILDSTVRIPDLIQKAKEFGMPAVAITDHGVMYGAVEFYQAAQKAGITPIIGCEVYIAPGSLFEKQPECQSEREFHFTLLAENEEGYKNLVKLVSIGQLDGMHLNPRIDREHLAKYAKGLIGLSGCWKGEITVALREDNYARTRELAATYRDILGAQNFFLEMQNNGRSQQIKVNHALREVGQEFGLGLVATNDVHFLNREDYGVHDTLTCIGETTGMNAHIVRCSSHQYFKSPWEMRTLFSDHPDACDNTLLIAERCGFQFDTTPKYPNYEPPAGKTQNEYLREITQAGIRRRYGSQADSAEVQQRYQLEIAVLEKHGFVNYFLIVWDYVCWAKEHGILVGPGRGTVGGSLVAYAIGITDIDPLKFNLLFERFINPENVIQPDIDVDFCQNRRPEVIEYVHQKYGERAVAHIVTFGTFGAKSAIRDVASAMGRKPRTADRLAKLVPCELGIHLAEAIAKSPKLQSAVEGDPGTRHLWDVATKVEGLTRGVGTHAAAIVTGPNELSDYIPLMRASDGSIVSQYGAKALADIGLLKLDFMGLRVLTIIADVQALIRKSMPSFNIDSIPLDDRNTYELLNRGKTIGVFLLDSELIMHLCPKFGFQNIEDINAILALYRVGPMDLIPDYIKCKKGLAKIKCAHPLLERVCADTYGIFIYQEQFISAVHLLAGYTLGRADLLRRSMRKKADEKMGEERAAFVEGCRKTNDISSEKANQLFDLLRRTACICFNRSHSAAYALMSYRAAYLKANYPVEFMTAVIHNAPWSADDLGILEAECGRMGINTHEFKA